MAAELAGLGAGAGPHSPGADCRLCPAVAGCVFPRTPEARPQCRARGAEEGCERRGELGRLVGGPGTRDAHQTLLCLSDWVLVPGKTACALPGGSITDPVVGGESFVRWPVSFVLAQCLNFLEWPEAVFG